MDTKNVIAFQANKTDFPISPKGTNIVGYYQDHRTDMAIQDWTVEHVESSNSKSFKRNHGE